MNDQTPARSSELAVKIARLVEERGWNQEDFARLASLNRQTVRQILQPNGERRLPLERLLPRMTGQATASGEATLCRLYDQATQPELLAWLERNPARASRLSEEEMDELLSLQGTGGPLTGFGVEHFVDLIERKRRLIQQVHAIAGTEYLDLLEKLIELMFDKVQPYPDRA